MDWEAGTTTTTQMDAAAEAENAIANAPTAFVFLNLLKDGCPYCRAYGPELGRIKFLFEKADGRRREADRGWTVVTLTRPAWTHDDKAALSALLGFSVQTFPTVAFLEAEKGQDGVDNVDIVKFVQVNPEVRKRGRGAMFQAAAEAWPDRQDDLCATVTASREALFGCSPESPKSARPTCCPSYMLHGVFPSESEKVTWRPRFLPAEPDRVALDCPFPDLCLENMTWVLYQRPDLQKLVGFQEVRTPSSVEAPGDVCGICDLDDQEGACYAAAATGSPPLSGTLTSLVQRSPSGCQVPFRFSLFVSQWVFSNLASSSSSS